MQERTLSVIGSVLVSALLLTAAILLTRDVPAQAAPSAAGHAVDTRKAVAAVELSPGYTKTVDPGVVVTYTHTITNDLSPRTITLTHHSSQGWTVTHVPTVALGSLQSADFSVRVTVPSDGGGKTDVTTITATWKAAFGGTSTVTVADTTVVKGPTREVYLPVLMRAYRFPILDWSRGGLAGQTVYQIAVCGADPNRLYAGTETGVFRSSNAGASWQATELRGVLVRGVDVADDDCDEVYAATWGQYVRRSKDGGAHWDTLSAGLPTSSLYTVVVDDRPLPRLYAGTAENGVYQYSDIGGSWTSIFGHDDGLVVGRLALAESGDLLVATWGSNAYRLRSGFAKWNETLLNVPEDNVFEVVEAGNGDLFAATEHHLYRRANQGWTQVHNRATFGVAPDPDQADVVYAATEDGAWRSMDGGESFDRFGLGGVTVRDVAPGPQGSTLLHAGTAEEGAWRRTRP